MTIEIDDPRQQQLIELSERLGKALNTELQAEIVFKLARANLENIQQDLCALAYCIARDRAFSAGTNGGDK